MDGKLALRMFQARVQNDLAAAQSAALIVAGKRLGLYRALAREAMSARDLATATGLNERQASSWLLNQSAAGYVTHDAATGTFRLDAEQVRTFADEDSATYVVNSYEFVLSLASVAEEVIDAAARDGALPANRYPAATSASIGRMTRARVGPVLDSWLSPAVRERLGQDAHVIDIGCGAGDALLALASRFPSITAHGIDLDPRAIDTAIMAAQVQGSGHRVTFECGDITRLLDARHADVLLCVETLHELADPRPTLVHLRNLLGSGGRAVFVEPLVTNSPGSLGSFDRYIAATEFLFCIPTSEARGGHALGAFAGEQAFANAVLSAGFSAVTRIPSETHLVLEGLA